VNVCPQTGQPCPFQKCIHITDLTPESKDVKPKYAAKEVVDLCLGCGSSLLAEATGEGVITGTLSTGTNNVQEFLNLIFNSSVPTPEMGSGFANIASPQKLCPGCSFSVHTIAATGKVGCGECYNTFKKELSGLINKCQAGATTHKGKVPKNTPEVLKSLEAKLKDAVIKEDYAEAARLRDEIKKLKPQ
jgi:protein-arginine kinase activator protein McsA